MAKGINLRINELKGNLYRVINESQLESGIIRPIVKEVLADVTQANIQSVKNELGEYMKEQKEQKENKGEECEDGKAEVEH